MDDLIIRQAAIDAIFSEPLYESGMKKRDADAAVIAIYEKIKSLPSAQPKQKVGKWIRHENEDGEPYGHNCSVCGEWYVMPYGKTKFCPNCGAKMEEQDD